MLKTTVASVQGTLPSTLKEPSSISMWKGAKLANLVLVFCFFPLAIGGYRGFGNKANYPHLKVFHSKAMLQICVNTRQESN